MTEEEKTIEDCFVIMPISDPKDYEKGHFLRVYKDIISPACVRAGFNPVRADDVSKTNLIHLDILNKLLDSPMAICDLSSRNPNVLFELGIRQAFDKPVVLIQEEGTEKIFDISPIRTIEYRKERIYHEVQEDQEKIKNAIIATKEAAESDDTGNSIVNLLSMGSPATLTNNEDFKKNPMLQYILAEINGLKNEFRNSKEKRTSPRGNYYNTKLKELKDLYDNEISQILMVYEDSESLGNAKNLVDIGFDLIFKLKNKLPPDSIYNNRLTKITSDYMHALNHINEKIDKNNTNKK